MKLSFLLNRLVGGLLILSLAAGSAFAQGITTSAMNGFVNDSSGKPVAGATVTVLHEPSGTRITTTTRANGLYSVNALRVGGPYTVTASGPGVTAPTQKEIYVTLDQNAEVDFGGNAEIVKLDAFKVTESADTTFDT